MEDPEGFLEDLAGRRVVLDEIHRLDNPSQLLKIAADHFRDTHILATGPSTLGASAKFKDTLAGRKIDLWLTPMIGPDLRDFGNEDLGHRLLRGGLPPFFMARDLPERDFQEWMDAYWAEGHPGAFPAGTEELIPTACGIAPGSERRSLRDHEVHGPLWGKPHHYIQLPEGAGGDLCCACDQALQQASEHRNNCGSESIRS